MNCFDEIKTIAQNNLWHTLEGRGIDIRDYPSHEMKLLDYNQITASFSDPLSSFCRGLLVDYTGNVIRKGFTRFPNLGQAGYTTFDFENSIAFEKADGSLMFVYFCPPTNQWEIGTRGTAFAEGPNEWHGTFRGFMLAAMERTEAQFQIDCTYLNRENTYLFEAVGPDNRIVTPYETNHLIELSTITTKTGYEVTCQENVSAFKTTQGWNVRPIKQYKFNTQADCLIALDALTGLQEGYVVYNTQTKMRVKIKNATYLAAHRLRGNGLTANAICELVAMNEVDEYLATFPEDSHKFDAALVIHAEMKHRLVHDYDAFKHLETQKEFALAVKDLPLACCMFKARANKSDVIHEFNQFPVSRRAEWIKERLQTPLERMAEALCESTDC